MSLKPFKGLFLDLNQFFSCPQSKTWIVASFPDVGTSDTIQTAIKNILPLCSQNRHITQQK